MKTTWFYLFEDTDANDPLSRARAASALRAARSRRPHNVERYPYGYRIKDAGMRLIKTGEQR